MENYGAGIYLEDDDVTPEKLLELLKDLIKNKNKLFKMQENAYGLAKFNGTYEIVKLIKSAIR